MICHFLIVSFPDPIECLIKMANQIQTRQDLFDLFRLKFLDKKSPIFIKSVPVKSSEAFKEAIGICLQEILGIQCVHKLTPAELVKFEKEVNLWYKKVPGYWKVRPVNFNYRSFEQHHAVFLSKEVHLGSNDDKNPEVINFAHLRNTRYGILFITRDGSIYRASIKSSLPIICLWNRRPLKVLN